MGPRTAACDVDPDLLAFDELDNRTPKTSATDAAVEADEESASGKTEIIGGKAENAAGKTETLAEDELGLSGNSTTVQ